jgi:hypothetical protein
MINRVPPVEKSDFRGRIAQTDLTALAIIRVAPHRMRLYQSPFLDAGSPRLNSFSRHAYCRFVRSGIKEHMPGKSVEYGAILCPF